MPRSWELSFAVSAEELAELEALSSRLAVRIEEAQRAPAETAPRLLVFRAGARRCALPLAAVREVVAPGALSRVPRAPASVLGIMNVRGRVVAVVDLAEVLPVQPGVAPERSAPAGDGRVLLLERGRRETGLLVSAVEGIVASAVEGRGAAAVEGRGAAAVEGRGAAAVEGRGAAAVEGSVAGPQADAEPPLVLDPQALAERIEALVV